MLRADLDFLARDRAHPLGWLLLLAGGLLLAAVVAQTFRVGAESERLRERIGQAQQARQASAREGRPEAPELLAARRVVAAVNRPWRELFETLEGADTDQVSLLALRPRIVARELWLAAEARDLGAMLAYHRWLEGRPQLRDVSLLRHEALPAAAGAVGFELRATWGGGDVRP